MPSANSVNNSSNKAKTVIEETQCPKIDHLSTKESTEIPNINEHNNFKCIYTNVDCLTNKIEEIELFLNKYNIDIAAIAGTKPKNSTEIKKLNLNIKDYNCEEDPTGRGICLYFKEHIDIFRFSDIESLFNPSIFCKATINNKTVCQSWSYLQVTKLY